MAGFALSPSQIMSIIGISKEYVATGQEHEQLCQVRDMAGGVCMDGWDGVGWFQSWKVKKGYFPPRNLSVQDQTSATG